MKLLIKSSNGLPVGNTLSSEFSECSFQVRSVWISMTRSRRSYFRFMMNFVPSNNVFSSRCHRTSNSKNQSPLKSNLQQPQYPPASVCIRKITNSRKTNRVICLTRVWVFGSLNPRRNAKKRKKLDRFVREIGRE